MKTKRFFKCSECAIIHYCSAACQKADWKHHKTICFKPKLFSVLDRIYARQTSGWCGIKEAHRHARLAFSDEAAAKDTQDFLSAFIMLECQVVCFCTQTRKNGECEMRMHAVEENIYLIQFWCVNCKQHWMRNHDAETSSDDPKFIMVAFHPHNITQYRRLFVCIPAQEREMEHVTVGFDSRQSPTIRMMTVIFQEKELKDSKAEVYGEDTITKERYTIDANGKWEKIEKLIK